MGDALSEALSESLLFATRAEGLPDALADVLSTHMQILIRQLGKVLSDDALALERGLKTQSSADAPDGQRNTSPGKRCRSPPRDATSHATGEVSPSLASERGSSEESFSGSDAGSLPNKVRKERKRRPRLEALERRLMDSAFEAKFGQRRDEVSDTSDRPSPSSSIVPVFTSMPGVTHNGIAIASTYSSMSTVPRVLSFVFGAVPLATARLCGVVPWSRTRKLSSSGYQWSLILSLCGCICDQCLRLGQNYSFGVVAEMCLSIGAVLTLLGCGALRLSSGLLDCGGRLDAYVESYECQYLLDRSSCLDIVVNFCVVASLNSLRVLGKGFVDRSDTIVAFASCVITGSACFLGRMSTMLGWLVDYYCERMVFNSTYAEAAREWYLLDSLCTLVSATVQYSFVTLQLTSMALLIFLFVETINGEASFLSLVPALLCAFSTMRMWIGAALVSEKCSKVPKIFTTAGNGNLDAGRSQVVEYILCCRSGFYIFGMRVSFELTLKLLYSVCATFFTLLSRQLLWS